MYPNTGFLQKLHGILQLCEVVLGIICVALAGSCYSDFGVGFKVNIFFLTISVLFFVMTLLMVICCLISAITHDRLRQTLFEPMYHLLGLILLFSASVAVLAENDKLFHVNCAKVFLAAGSFGLINSFLYGISAYDSYLAYVNA